MIRKATHNDIESIMTIVRSAQSALAELGIDQWQDGYPTQEVIADDINAGIGYLSCDSNNIALGYAAIVKDGEPAYTQIPDTAWHTPNSYVVIHRLCVAEGMRRRGVALQLMRYAVNLAHDSNITAMRIDTHEGNIRMLAMLNKLGFEYCGKIIYEQSGERLAYDINFSLDNKL